MWVLTACLIVGSCSLTASTKASAASGGLSIQDKIDDVVDDINNGEFVPPEDVPNYPTSYQVLDHVAFVSAGGDHTAAITQDGTLYTWGSNFNGQLGVGHTEDTDGPQKVMEDVSFVCVSYDCTAAVKKDGTLWTWGKNFGHNLGFSSQAENCPTPTQVMSGVASVSVGYDFMAVLKTDGTLWTFGENEHGQLGNGTRTASAAPVQILDNVKSVHCDDGYAAAIRTDGTLWVWGDQDPSLFSSLIPSNTDLLRPVQLMEDVIDVAYGGHIAVVKADHTLWIWGTNSHGQVGNGTRSDIDLSAPVQIMTDVQQVDIGYEHTIALKTDGSVWSWGANYLGQAGHKIQNGSVPQQIIKQADSITAGGQHSFALDEDGFLWAWGANDSGQLGKREIKDSEYLVYYATFDAWFTLDCRIEPVPIGRSSGINAEDYISDWARADVEAAKAAGLIPPLTGSPTYLDIITREQFAELVVRFLETALGHELPAAPANTFTDCQNPAVLKAYAAGVISGVGEGRFSPDTTTNREQLATMINRAIDYYNAETGGNLAPAAPELSGFADSDAISSWAVDSMGRLVSNKIMAGTSVILLQPQGYCTVEQSVLLLYRLYQKL